ncbi:MAG: biotin/lipoyl-binding protein, partial [Anaerolineae bacterium]
MDNVMKHGRTGLLLSLLAGIAIIGVIVAWFARPERIAVLVEVVERGTVQDTVANTKAGTIEACRRAGISPRLGGQIDLMPVSEGDVVEAGQILMEFWNDDLRAQLKLAASELQASEAKREQICIVADSATREAARQRRLGTQKLASEEAIDTAESEALSQQAA